jgi:hypothetical protein
VKRGFGGDLRKYIFSAIRSVREELNIAVIRVLLRFVILLLVNFGDCGNFFG